MSKLKELKEEQERLREHIFAAFKESGLSVSKFAQQVGIPYGTMRRVLNNQELGYKTILKLIEWWEKN